MNAIGIASGFDDPYLRYIAGQMARQGISLLVPTDHLDNALLHKLPVTAWQETGTHLPFPVLHGLATNILWHGMPDIGVAGFEHAHRAPDIARHFRGMRLVLAPSTWTARLLREAGLANVIRFPHGVDTALYHPGPRDDIAPGRFLVFLGGPLAYRTGPDIAIDAFRLFRNRHPEAMLVPAWWVPEAGEWQGPADFVSGRLPQVEKGGMRIDRWLADRGIGPEDVLDPGQFGWDVPRLLRECSVAAFPDRGSAGANPLALAALASGVPTILSANTGNLDLIGEHLVALKEQRGLDVADGRLAGWGESSVEDVALAMRRIHDLPLDAATKGRAARDFALTRDMSRLAEQLLVVIGEAAAGGDPVLPAEVADYDWGLCLHRAGHIAEAARIYTSVLTRQPGHMDSWVNLGNLGRMARADETALSCIAVALALKPDDARTWRSYGNTLREAGRLAESAEALHRSVRIDSMPKAHWELASTLLHMGRYAEAWPHFDYRYEALGMSRPANGLPRWDGAPVRGRTLLVLDEQGLGDTLQFLRFLPLIPVGEGGRVAFAGKAEVVSPVRRVLPAQDVFDWKRPQPLPEVHCWIGLMSLPAMLGIDRPEQVPPSPPVFSDPARLARWRPLVRGSGDGDNRPVVGLCWRGNPHFSGDRIRSPGLAPLNAILDVEGVRFVSLQVGDGRQELLSVPGGERIIDIGDAREASGLDLLDAIAAIQNCDLVISSCTSTAHMAGVAGVPGWILLSDQSDWRWMTGRSDSPWYPSLTLLRQKRPGDWEGLAVDVARTLARWRDGLAAPTLSLEIEKPEGQTQSGY